LAWPTTTVNYRLRPPKKNCDLVIIAGQSWPAKISRQRDHLIALIQKHGFAQTLENVAYTWFNRFAALRYMDIKKPRAGSQAPAWESR
jgi:hypothetical protein